MPATLSLQTVSCLIWDFPRFNWPIPLVALLL